VPRPSPRPLECTLLGFPARAHKTGRRFGNVNTDVMSPCQHALCTSFQVKGWTARPCFMIPRRAATMGERWSRRIPVECRNAGTLRGSTRSSITIIIVINVPLQKHLETRALSQACDAACFVADCTDSSIRIVRIQGGPKISIGRRRRCKLGAGLGMGPSFSSGFIPGFSQAICHES